MPDGIRLTNAYVEIGPDVNTVQFSLAGARAGQAFAKAMNDAATKAANAPAAKITKDVEAAWSSVRSTITSAATGAANAVVGSMQVASKSVSILANTVNSTAGGLRSFGTAMTQYVSAPIALASAAATKFGLDMAMNLEDATVALRALLPAGYDVDAMLTRLQAFSKSSPVFDISQVLDFTRTLVGAGVAAQQTEPMLDALNKIFVTYGVTGDKAAAALLGVSQVFTKGKAQAQELTLQIGQQIPIWHLLSEASGQSIEQLQSLSEAGQFSSQMFSDLLLKIGQMPAVTASAAAGSQTLRASWNQLKESLQQQLGEAFLAQFPAIKQALADLTPALEWLVTKFVSGIPGAIFGVTEFIAAFKDPQGTLDKIRTIGPAFDSIVNAVEKLKAMYDQLTPQQQKWIGDILHLVAVAGPGFVVISKVLSGIAATVGLISVLLDPWAALILGVAAAVGFLGLKLYQIWHSPITEANRFRDAINAFVDAWSRGWKEEVEPAAKGLLDSVQANLIPAFDHLLHALGFDSWSELGTWLGANIPKAIAILIDGVRFMADRWADLIFVISDVITVSKGIIHVFDEIDAAIHPWVEDLISAFDHLVAGAKQTWNELYDIFAAPTRFAIEVVYDKGIVPLFNMVSDALNLGWKLPEFHPDLNAPHFASGGVVPGNGSEGDWVPFFGTAGERVLSLDEVSALGGYGGINALISSMRHYADGGILGSIGDIAGWVGGKASSPVPGGIVSSISSAMNLITSSINGITDSKWGQLIKGVGHTILDSFLAKINPLDKAAKTTFLPPGSLGGAVPTGSLAQWIAAAESITGVGASWTSGLTTLIMRESGGNPNAINNWDINAQNGDPSRGLMQTIGSTFAAYRDPALSNNIYDPVANIVAGIRYIISRYGSIGNVQQANASMPPMGYDSGGIIPPGDTLVRNNTGQNEHIFNPSQSRAISDGLTGPRVVHVTIIQDGFEQHVEAVLDQHDRAIVRELRAGRRK